MSDHSPASTPASSRLSTRPSSTVPSVGNETPSPDMEHLITAIGGLGRLAAFADENNEEKRKKLSTRVRKLTKPSVLQHTINKLNAATEAAAHNAAIAAEVAKEAAHRATAAAQGSDSESDDDEDLMVHASIPAPDDKVRRAEAIMKEMFPAKLSAKTKEIDQFVDMLLSTANNHQLNGSQTEDLLLRHIEGGLLQHHKVVRDLKPGLHNILKSIKFYFGERLSQDEYERRVNNFRLSAHKSIRDALGTLHGLIHFAHPEMDANTVYHEAQVRALQQAPRAVVEALTSKHRTYKRRHANRPWTFLRFVREFEGAMADHHSKVGAVSVHHDQPSPTRFKLERSRSNSPVYPGCQDVPRRAEGRAQSYQPDRRDVPGRSWERTQNYQPAPFGRQNSHLGQEGDDREQAPRGRQVASQFQSRFRPPTPGAPRIRFLSPDDPACRRAKVTMRHEDVFDKNPGGEQRPGERLPYTWVNGRYLPRQKVRSVPRYVRVFCQRRNGRVDVTNRVVTHFEKSCIACGMEGHGPLHRNCPMRQAELTWDLCQTCRGAFHNPSHCRIHEDGVTKN